MPIRGTGSHVAHASNGSVGAAFGLARTAFLAPAIAVAADGSDLAVAQQPVEIDVKSLRCIKHGLERLYRRARQVAVPSH